MSTTLRLSALLMMLGATLIGCRTDKGGADSGAAGSGSGSGTTNGLLADAGDDQEISAEASVQLDGTGSYNPSGDPLTYHWAFEHVPDGSALDESESPFSANNTEAASEPTFQPDAVGTYVVALYVSAGSDSSEKDYVVITTTEPEELPIADAGFDLSGKVGVAVNLDGSGSYDLKGRSLTYDWDVSQTPTGSSVSTVLNETAAIATFTPDMKGYYTFTLTVNNGLADSLPDSVVVYAYSEDDESPIANAGPNALGEDCSWIDLDGSGSSDPDGDALTYYWDVQSVPAGSTSSTASFSDQSGETTRFYADIAGTYNLSLTVSDGENWSVPDSITLVVSERSYNTPPIITLGEDTVLAAGTAECEETAYGYECDECDAVVTTIGDDITVEDIDGDEFTVEWEVVSGDATVATPTSLVTSVSFDEAAATAPDECSPNEYVLLLTATDCTGESSTAPISIIVECCGEIPRKKKDTGDTSSK